MLADNRKATLQAIHTDAVNKAIKDRKKNLVLDDLPHPINDSEKDITRKERTTLAQLRSGHCKLLGSYKSRIKKDASLNVCADCGRTPHDCKHFFVCPAHPTTLIPSDLWSKPVESIREFSYLEEENLDRDERRTKANNNINNTKQITIANIYIPPRDSTSTHYKTVDTDIQHCIHHITNITHSVLTGDVNAHSTLWHSYTDDHRGRLIADVISNLDHH